MYFKTTVKEKDGVEYTHYRLCENYREGRRSLNRTLLSLGNLEQELTKEKMQLLCKRINDLYFKNRTFVISAFRDDKVEELCFGIVAKLRKKAKEDKAKKKAQGIDEINTDRTKVSKVREIGSEWLCLQASRQLGLEEFFRNHRWSEDLIKLALVQIISRAIYPCSELKTTQWLKENSGLCELLGLDPQKITKDKLYEMSLKLYEKKEDLEKYLSKKTNELFSLENKIILYDLTNFYFEGSMRKSDVAQFGRSKEKRSDAKLIVLAAVSIQKVFEKVTTLCW